MTPAMPPGIVVPLPPNVKGCAGVPLAAVPPAPLVPGCGAAPVGDVVEFPEPCAGAATIAQDEATSVVWGMPGAAWQIGAAQSLHPLPQIAARVLAIAGAPREALQRTNLAH